MLRLSQKLSVQLSKCGPLAGAQRCLFADAPAVQSGEEAVKEYDPAGPPSQMDNYMEGLDEGYVSSFRTVKNLVGELQKLEAARARVRPQTAVALYRI